MVRLNFDTITFVFTIIVLYAYMFLGHLYGNMNFGDLNPLVSWIPKKQNKSISKVKQSSKQLEPNYGII